MLIRPIAPRTTTPMHTCCQKAETLRSTNPVVRVAMNKAPTKVPNTPPIPPERLVPPITTAAMAFNSYPCPATGWPENSLEVYITPLRRQRIRTVRTQGLNSIDVNLTTLLPLRCLPGRKHGGGWCALEQSGQRRKPLHDHHNVRYARHFPWPTTGSPWASRYSLGACVHIGQS